MATSPSSLTTMPRTTRILRMRWTCSIKISNKLVIIRESIRILRTKGLLMLNTLTAEQHLTLTLVSSTFLSKLISSLSRSLPRTKKFHALLKKQIQRLCRRRISLKLAINKILPSSKIPSHKIGTQISWGKILIRFSSLISYLTQKIYQVIHRKWWRVQFKPLNCRIVNFSIGNNCLKTCLDPLRRRDRALTPWNPISKMRTHGKSQVKRRTRLEMTLSNKKDHP